MAFFSRRGNGGGRMLRGSLDGDMRAIDRLANDHAGAAPDGSFDLHGYVLGAFDRAPTRDIRYLADRGWDGQEFHVRELAPNWRGLTREQRAAKIATFVRFANLLDNSAGDDDVAELRATVRTKIVLLACAYDTQYEDSYRRRIARNPARFGEFELARD
jgi:hypothetical protein